MTILDLIVGLHQKLGRMNIRTVQGNGKNRHIHRQKHREVIKYVVCALHADKSATLPALPTLFYICICNHFI